jgi:hypothetical protein
MTAGGNFYSAEITLTADETYEVRAVAEWDDGGTQYEYGSTLEFETTWQTEYGLDFEAGDLTDVEGELGELTLAPATYSSDVCANMSAYNSPSPNRVWQSSEYSSYYRGFKAFDGTGASSWGGSLWFTQSGQGAPSWIWYDWGAGNDKQIRKYTIRNRSDATSTAPKSWTYTPAHVDFASVHICAEYDQTFSNGEVKTFYVPKHSPEDFYTGGRYALLKISETGGSGYCAIAEITYHALAAYLIRGTRVSLPIDINALGATDTMPISWTATTPTNTDVTIETAVTGESTITDEAVGTGDGTETVFALDYYPVTRLDDLVVEVDGTPTTSYSISGKTITFDTAPGNTLTVTASYTGIDEPIETAEVQEIDLDSPSGGTFKLSDGSTWTADIDAVQYELGFDGTNDYVKTGSQITLGTSNWTIEGWIKPRSSTGYSHFFSTSSSQNCACKISNLKPYFYNSSGFRTYTNDSEPLVVNEWSHLAYVFDGSTVDIFVNGYRIASEGVTGVSIGADYYQMQGTNSEFGNACTAEVRVWTAARTQAEIRANMHSRLAGTETNLLAYWPMNEGTGTTITDQAGTNDCTVYGASWAAEGFITTFDLHTELESLYGSGKVDVTEDTGVFTITFDISVGNSNLTADFTGLT